MADIEVADAGDVVVAAVAVEHVVGLVAEDEVVAGAAVGVLDQRGGVAFEQVRVVDVAVRGMAGAESGELGAEIDPAAGIEVDVQVGRVVGEVVGIDAAAVPDVMNTLLPPGVPWLSPLMKVWPVVVLQL